MTQWRRMNRWLAVVSAASLAGCASPGPKTAPAAIPTGEEARAVEVWNGNDGRRVDWGNLVSGAAGAEVVVIGENHGHPLGLAFAAALWEDVLARPEGEKAALSMEFFERDDQVALDAYLLGVATEAHFKRATGRTDSRYPAGHRAMVEAAKAKGVPVIAANAPWIYMSYAGREPYEKLAALPEEHRRLFRIPDSLPTGRYRSDYARIMDKPHGPAAGNEPETPEAKAARIEKGFRSQSLWDWTMAESVVRAVGAGHSPVVHVVGRFHSDFDGGLIEAIEKQRPGTRVVTITTVDEGAASLKAEDKGRADYVVYVGPAPDAS